MRISQEKAKICLRILLEGTSIRSVSRITGVHQETVTHLVTHLGQRSEKYLDRRIRGLAVTDVQIDEIWGFVRMKERTREIMSASEDYGHAYCFTALERTSKLLLAWHVGKRSSRDADRFAAKLNRATTGGYQLTADGFRGYQTAIPSYLGNVDFGVIVKDLESFPEDVRPLVTGRKSCFRGSPDPDRISTSHVERMNLTIRMYIRRMTRKTNAFSKKLFNHKAALALFFCYYNFCRKHMTLKTTPAVAAGLETEVWPLERLFSL